MRKKHITCTSAAVGDFLGPNPAAALLPSQTGDTVKDPLKSGALWTTDRVETVAGISVKAGLVLHLGVGEYFYDDFEHRHGLITFTVARVADVTPEHVVLIGEQRGLDGRISGRALAVRNDALAAAAGR